MSKKTQLKAAKKRSLRATASKEKRGKPANWQRRENELNTTKKRLFGPGGLITDALNKGSAVERAIAAAKSGQYQFDEGMTFDKDELVENTRKATTEVYRLFSYISMGEALIRHGRIEHTIGINIDEYAKRIVELDRRVQRLTPLKDIVQEEEVFAFELMDIGESLQTLAEELYAEVTRMEPHALVLEAYLEQAAHTLISNDTKVTDKAVATNQVLEAMAFAHIGKYVQVPEAA